MNCAPTQTHARPRARRGQQTDTGLVHHCHFVMADTPSFSDYTITFACCHVFDWGSPSPPLPPPLAGEGVGGDAG